MNLKSTSKSGFTLVELLVTILIIVILSVTMLPLLKPFVTQAQYSAEGVPVIGNIRTKVELFRIENDYLPGVPMKDDGSVVVNSETPPYSTSYISGLHAGSDAISTTIDGTQWMKTETANGTTSEKFYVGFGSETALETDTGLADHVWKRLSINYSDLTGKKLRPEDIQYEVIKSDGDTFYWVVSCFGHGSGGLAGGCGYAVAEFNDPVHKHKFVATFENYKPVNTDQLHISVVNADWDKRDTGLQAGVVYLPDVSAVEGNYDTAVSGMRTFGWQVQ